MSPDPAAPMVITLGGEHTYSAQEAAALLGHSFSWLDQRVRNAQFDLPDGTPIRPLRTPGGYRRFTSEMLRDIAFSCYRHCWFKMDQLKVTLGQLAMAAYRDTGEYRI